MGEEKGEGEEEEEGQEKKRIMKRMKRKGVRTGVNEVAEKFYASSMYLAFRFYVGV